MKLCSAILSAAIVGAVVPGAAQAAIIINITQSGTNVVASGSGSFNTTGLQTAGSFSNLQGIFKPSASNLRIGAGSETLYSGLTGSSTFGSSTTMNNATVSSGDVFGLNGAASTLFLPLNYVSGTALSGSATYAGTFASLGLTIGSYVFTSGADSITVNIGGNAVAVPEPATWGMMILGFGLVGGAVRYRRRSTTATFA